LGEPEASFGVLSGEPEASSGVFSGEPEASSGVFSGEPEASASGFSVRRTTEQPFGGAALHDARHGG